ncbi:hypothetical protein Glove_144g55 [Diversispora epigaea]|uniref:Uncharacterized protein n=1 Tax=Diversispora epigaea TaxID=1348612 RepID=A0A397IU46_9GLOM|nr:hypothetical protein Glove_144g55 [Diversispora epigaea]
MTELREKLSQYIGFEPEEIHLLITEEDKQLFRELITGQEEITDIVMEEKVLAHIEKRFEDLPLAPVIIVD